MRSPGRPKVFIYMDGLPRSTGSGAHLRYYSNARAYLDLGFDVEAVHVTAHDDGSEPDASLKGLAWSRVVAPAQSRSAAGKIAYRLGWPTRAGAAGFYPLLDAVRTAAIAKERSAPGAIHQFENDYTASAIPFIPGMKKIFSSHCLASETVQQTNRIARELEGRTENAAEKREYRFMSALEQRSARAANLVLCISTYDLDAMRSRWRLASAEYLPMSIPDENQFESVSPRSSGSSLRLLHIGALAHLPSFRSLEFLLERVFPNLAPNLLDRIVLRVVGAVDSENQRAKKLLGLFARYPQVQVAGFVPDVRNEFLNNDLHVVASTEIHGLRTRIVESFAYGLPVLSTTAGSCGIEGLRGGENIILADQPEEYAKEIASCIENPERLTAVRDRARKLYESGHSRAVVAKRLQGYLAKWL